MSQDVLTVGSTMRIPLLYRGEYSQWVERFMNYLEEQTDGEAMINSIKNGDQPLPCVTQVSIAGTSSNEPLLKDKSMCNMIVKDLWDALARYILGYEYGEQDRKAAVLYEYETFKATKGELLLDTYIRYLQVINDLKKCGYSKDNYVSDSMGLKKKTVVVTSDPLALIAEKTKVSKSKEKVVVSLDSRGSDADDFSELKKITSLLAKAFNRKKFYSKPTNNNLRTSSTSQSANKKQEFVKSDDKKVEKKIDEKKRDMSRVKCYNCKKEGHFAKDCKKVKVKDYEYYKTKMLLAKKDKDKQVLLAEDQALMESSSDSDQEINANIVFMAQIEKVLSDSKASSSSADEKISEQTSSLKPYVPNVILEKIKIDLEDEVCDKVENSKVIALGMFKLSVSQSVSPISMSKTSCDSKNVENLDTFNSVRRPKHSGVIWKKKGLSNTSNVDLSSVSHLKLNKDVKRYSRKDLLSYKFFRGLFSRDNKSRFEKIDSPFQQTSSLKPYVPTVILEKIIIDLEDEVVSILEKEKANLETIKSLKSKGFESSENAISESK
nr:hypothetical protein [Tanacetum cinerariifolium]